MNDQYKALFEKYGISITDSQLQQFDAYADLLINEKQNLSAIRDKGEIWIRHFLDSAYIAQFLSENAKILDIGTGGGIPAIPIAILRPDLNINMLDSEQNKIEFCEKAVHQLNLNAKPICARGEELAHDPDYRGQFDYVVSRAMASGSMLTELSMPFLKVGGKLIAMKGRSFDPETERFHAAASVLHCPEPEYRPYELEQEQKMLVIVTLTEPVDAKYPRRFAKIKRQPL